MSDTLSVATRENLGSRASQRLRAEGVVPAVLYGHKEDALSLAVPAEQVRKALGHNAKVVNLDGAASGQAVIQAIQWDTFHRHLLHIDLLRVDAGEKVHVNVPLELKGEAPGSNEGGVVELMIHSIDLEAAPASIPEVLHVSVEDLHLGGSLTAGQITDLPEGAELQTPADTVVAHCVPPAGAPALDSVAEEAGSPEVIGKGGDGEEAKD